MKVKFQQAGFSGKGKVCDVWAAKDPPLMLTSRAFPDTE